MLRYGVILALIKFDIYFSFCNFLTNLTLQTQTAGVDLLLSIFGNCFIMIKQKVGVLVWIIVDKTMIELVRIIVSIEDFEAPTIMC